MLSSLLTQTLYESAGILGAELLGVYNVIQPSDSLPVKYLKTGGILSAIDELTNYLRSGTTWILNGQYYLSLDNLVYNSGAWAILDFLGITQRVLNVSKDSLPSNISVPVGAAVIKISMATLQNILNAYGSNGNLSMWYIVHPVSALVAAA